MDTDLAAQQLEALGHPVRLQIYRILVRAGPSGLPVGQLQDRLAMPASSLSHHVKRLVRCGLIRQERDGTTLNCHAEYDAMNALLGFLADECCADAPPSETPSEVGNGAT
ncbi:ArsR/SmtB family transcription factor [Chachezhania sediminis]|uniref:ArsR/SmtB family transcription factor n=1 Tax=Chachezhania sediminis TaxID=2599291 RepID=UPI00131C5585|nr:metalloregulator ArsR/SmtB family transcription factor [Chachezhania sediminis]